MSATPSIKVIKTTPYKGGLRTWSNRYHFLGGTPADATHWHTLMDNVTTAEHLVHRPKVIITEAIGYAAGSDVPVASKVYSIAGAGSGWTACEDAPLNAAALIRWSTAARTTKNHPIYCFSYMHNCAYDNTQLDQDHLCSSEKTVLQTFATAWITGFSDGSITATRASPNGAAATGSIVEEYITHRDFPYQSSV